MSVEKQDDHIFDLWKKLYSRVRGALKIINTFGDIAMELNVLGKDKKTKELEELEQTKPHWFVLMPTDLIARVWQ